MELQDRYEELTRQGLGLIAVSYDSVETLKAFADARGITFPLVSDRDSAIIRRYGLLNETVEPGTRTHGIPHPGTFILDRHGVVTARFFEAAYQERSTAASILTRQGATPLGPTATADTAHLSVQAAVSDATVAPGERFSVLLEVTPRRGMHVYAPGRHSYQVVRLIIDPKPWLRAHAPQYPAPEIYHFVPLDERVEVYSKPFRLTTDVTILATPEVQKQLAGQTSLTISGALEYQACDDKVCFNPARVPLSFTLAVKPLDRRPVGR